MTRPGEGTSGARPAGMLEIGRIGRPHGVRGDLFVDFTSDVASRRAPGAEATVVVGGAQRSLRIATCRAQGDRHVVHFEGVDDRDAAEALVNLLLFAEPVETDDDTLWVHELIGSRVVDVSGREWGTCLAVLANPAHDILEISDGSLVPVPFVVSCADGVTVIDPPDGLDQLGPDGSSR